MTFISRIFYFRIIREVLNSRTSVFAVFMAYRNSLLARILNSRGIEFAQIFAKIKFSRKLPDLQYINSNSKCKYEPPNGKINNLHRRKQRRRSASR